MLHRATPKLAQFLTSSGCLRLVVQSLFFHFRYPRLRDGIFALVSPRFTSNPAWGFCLVQKAHPKKRGRSRKWKPSGSIRSGACVAQTGHRLPPATAARYLHYRKTASLSAPHVHLTK